MGSWPEWLDRLQEGAELLVDARKTALVRDRLG
jgi:hypothetical protein